VEIERAVLELEGMKDVAVVGVPDEEWGQVVSQLWPSGIIASRALRADLARSALAWSPPARASRSQSSGRS
jgi:acyl-coenzyme A synthetase/AMP-(fatty) acid ligase